MQALVKSTHRLIIYMVDPSNEALALAEARFCSVNQNFNGEVHYVHELGEVNVEIDICIVATTSSIRSEVCRELLGMTQVGHIVFEKVLFSDLEDYDLLLGLLDSKNTLGWVNCWRRMVPYYQNIKGRLNGKVQFEAKGQGYGLGSNGIHLLDFFMMVSEAGSIELSNEDLQKEVFDSKRPGFIEFMGEIQGRSADGDSVVIGCSEGEYSTIEYVIESSDSKYMIVEYGQNYALCVEAHAENDWKQQESRIELSYQSDLTQHIVDALLENNSCDLPSFSESVSFHKSYLANFIDFQKSIGYSQEDKCMIT